MDFLQIVTLGIALSGPTVIFVGIGRLVMSIDRSFRYKHRNFALFAFLSILGLLALLAVIIVVWFGYGVAHTGKDATTDAIVLGGTVMPSYVCVYGAWRLARYLEGRMKVHKA
jgi:hypothetical protein